MQILALTVLFCFNSFASSVYGYMSRTGASGYVSQSQKFQDSKPTNVQSLTPYRNENPLPNTATVQETQARMPIIYEQETQARMMQPITVPSPSGYYENQAQQNPYAGMERWNTPEYYANRQENYNIQPQPALQNSFSFQRYYNFGFAQPIRSQYKYSSSDGISRSTTQNSFLPIVDTNGMLSMTVGTRFAFLPNLKRELGVQWELLSFRENLPSNPKSKVYNHHISFTGKLLYDIPLTQTSYFTAGGELSYGFINHTVADDEYLTMGYSYAILAGFVKKISPQRDFYIMLRQGQMQKKAYKVINVSRNADLSSTSIFVGIHLLSR